MATSPTNRSVKDDEQEEVRREQHEVQTKEEEVGTEEVDPGKTTEEAEKEVRTEEEAINIDDEQQTENQKRQEDPITVRSRSGQMMERGSTSSASDPNRCLVPSGYQMSQAMGPSIMPPHQQDPFGLLQPRWLVVDHFYTDGLGLYGQLWRFRTITPLNPNENTYLPHHLGMMELPGQPGLVSVCYHQLFGVLQQDRLVPQEAPPQMMMQQNQFLSQAPMRPMLPQDQFVVYLGQVPVRPMMYYLEQNQIVPSIGIIGQQPPPSPPVTYTQDQTAHSLRQFDAPLMQPPVSSPMMMNYNYHYHQQFNQASPNAAAAAGLEEVNQQRQSQTQHSRQSSQGSNDGPDEPQG